MEELIKKTQEIIELKRNIGSNIWLVGNRLNEIKNSNIYLEKYSSWSHYLTEAVDLSERSSSKFMRIAKNFLSPQVSDWGANKLELLMSYEEPIRKKVMETHVPTDSRREIKETAVKLKSESLPEVNVEIDFFIELENLGRDALEKVNEFKIGLNSCQYKSSWDTYIRKKIILDQLDLIKEVLLSTTEV